MKEVILRRMWKPFSDPIFKTADYEIFSFMFAFIFFSSFLLLLPPQGQEGDHLHSAVCVYFEALIAVARKSPII
jgi:hypothetical protein